MPIASMQKVRVVGIRRQRRQILDLLQELGAMQVEEFAEKPSKLEREINYDSLLSEYEFAIDFLNAYETKKESFLDSFAVSKEHVSYREVKSRVREVIRSKPEKICRRIESELMNMNDLRKNLVRERALLEPWLGLDFPLNELTESKYATYFTGGIPPQGLEPLRQALANTDSAIEVIEEDKLNALILVAVCKEAGEGVQKILSENGFDPVRLPVSERTPSQEIDVIDVALTENEERRENIEAEARELAKSRFDLMLAHDYFLQKKEAQNTEKKLDLTTYTFSVEGWIRKRDLSPIQKRLSATFSSSMIAPIKPEDGEIAPVAIENSAFVKPFEAVTGIYGLPAYKEVDPTPLLAAFFIIFFGLCLGDAGYGITLTLVAFVFYKKAGPTSSARTLLKLLMYGGIATFIAGALIGGWFGVEPVDFPAFLKPVRNFLLSIRVLDPVKNPIAMLIVALAFGIVQVIFGLLVNFYIKIRDGEYLDAFLDNVIWIYFLLTLVAFIVQKAGAFMIHEQLSYFILGGAVALVLTQGRKQKSIVMKFVSGILSLYNTVGYFSDVLSYSRILALGLATSIIAMVINMVALMTKDMAPIIGRLIMILILIGGHIFNIAINVLGAFIHSSRLQFVEFFSKFMEGGGTESKPFKREAKFIEIVDS